MNLCEQEINQQLLHFFGGLTYSVRLAQFKQKDINSANRRRKEWELARVLEKQVQDDLSYKSVPIERVKISISHTGQIEGENWVVVAGSSIPIGVDLEWKFRKVHPGLYSRITTSEERAFSLSALQIWIIKEAAFKANPLNKGTWVSQYRVVQWNDTEQAGEVMAPSGKELKSGKFKLVETNKFLIAFVLIQAVQS